MTLQEQLALNVLVANGLHVQLKTGYTTPHAYKIEGKVVSVTMYPTQGVPRHLTLDSGVVINVEELDAKAITVFGKREVQAALAGFRGNHE